MPKFKVIRTVPATMTWEYEVEAEDAEDAVARIANGDYDFEEIDYSCEEDLWAEAEYTTEEITNEISK